MFLHNLTHLTGDSCCAQLLNYNDSRMKTKKETYIKIHSKYLVSILCALVLFSCDPVFHEIYILDNRSDFEIKISYSSYIATDSTIIVSPKTSMDFFYGGASLGCAEDLGTDFLLAYFDSISFSIDDSLAINKDCLNRENWEFFADNCRVANYKLTIENSDISINKLHTTLFNGKTGFLQKPHIISLMR